MNSLKYTILVIATSLLFISCGDGTTFTNNSKLNTGQFIDSPVQGLKYKTATQEGYTDENGKFYYEEGEEVEFFLGDLSFGKVDAQETITPYDLSGDSDWSNPSNQSINIARILQTVDSDTSDTSKIKLDIKVHDLNNSSFNFTQNSDAQLQSLISSIQALTNATYTLVDSTTATNNMYNYVSSNIINETIGFTYNNINGKTFYLVDKESKYFTKWSFTDSILAQYNMNNYLDHDGTYGYSILNGKIIANFDDGDIYTIEIRNITNDYINIFNSTTKSYANLYFEQEDAQTYFNSSNNTDEISTGGISVSGGFTEEWLNGKTLYTIFENNVYTFSFNNGYQSILGEDYYMPYSITSNGILKVDESSDGGSFQYYKILSLEDNGNTIMLCENDDTTEAWILNSCNYNSQTFYLDFQSAQNNI